MRRRRENARPVGGCGPSHCHAFLEVARAVIQPMQHVRAQVDHGRDRTAGGTDQGGSASPYCPKLPVSCVDPLVMNQEVRRGRRGLG